MNRDPRFIRHRVHENEGIVRLAATASILPARLPHLIDRNAKGSVEAAFTRRPTGQSILTGNPEQIATLIKRYEEIGVTHVTSVYPAIEDGWSLERMTSFMEVMTKEVMPHFQATM